MSVPRIYANINLAVGETVELPASAYRHLVIVLRRIRGDTITLFNGHGGEYSAVIETAKRNSLTAKVTGFHAVSRESPLNITLGQAISKGERMDYAIQKAVELGISHIQPLVTDHGVVKLSEERWLRKQEHWQGVANAAAEQTGRTKVPHVAGVVDLRDWLTVLPAESTRLVMSIGTETMLGDLDYDGTPILLAVGPEGDFSEIEKGLLELANFTGVGLGPRLLRTETAGVVALSVMQSLWGDLVHNRKP